MGQLNDAEAAVFVDVFVEAFRQDQTATPLAVLHRCHTLYRQRCPEGRVPCRTGDGTMLACMLDRFLGTPPYLSMVAAAAEPRVSIQPPPSLLGGGVGPP